MSNRRAAWSIVAGVVLAVVLVSVSTSGEVHLWHAGTGGSETADTSPAPSGTLDTVPNIHLSDSGQGGKASGLLVLIIEIIAAAGALAAIVAAVMTAWRNRPRLRWRAREGDDFEVLPDVARSITDDAEDQRAALLRGSPRNAIVECWLRLEAVVTAAGVERDPSDTPTDFTSRVLASYAIDPTAIRALAGLYREARFSTHDMGEAERSAAVSALDALHAELRRHVDLAASSS